LGQPPVTEFFSSQIKKEVCRLQRGGEAEAMCVTCSSIVKASKDRFNGFINEIRSPECQGHVQLQAKPTGRLVFSTQGEYLQADRN
jgi:hypothetical protein